MPNSRGICACLAEIKPVHLGGAAVSGERRWRCGSARRPPAREAPVGAQCARSSLFRAAQRPCFASRVLAYLEAGLWNCRVSNAGRAVAERRGGLGSGLVYNNRSKRHRSAGGRCGPCSSAAVAKVRSPCSVSRFRALPTAWRCVVQRGVIAFAGQERGFGSAGPRGQNAPVSRSCPSLLG